MCRFCAETDHCGLECDNCARKGRVLLNHLLDSVCLECIGRKTGHEKLTVLWEVIGNFSGTWITAFLFTQLGHQLELKLSMPGKLVGTSVPVGFEILIGNFEDHIGELLSLRVASPVLVMSGKSNSEGLAGLMQCAEGSTRKFLLADYFLKKIELLVPRTSPRNEGLVAQILENNCINRIQVLCKDVFIAIELANMGVPDPISVIKRAVLSGSVKESIFQYSATGETIRMLSLNYGRLDEKIIKIAVQSLESRAIIPFVSRVLDILVNDLGLVTSEEELVSVYKNVIRPSTFELPNIAGNQEQVLMVDPTNFSKSSIVTKESVQGKGKYNAFLCIVGYEPLPILPGTNTRALFYKFSRERFTKSTTLRDIYYFLEAFLLDITPTFHVKRHPSFSEAPILRNSGPPPRISLPDQGVLQDILSSILKERDSIEISELERLMLDLLGETQFLDRNTSFREFLLGIPQVN